MPGNNCICLFFKIKMDVINFIEYSCKCYRGDCTCYEKVKSSIEPFEAITVECILENQEDFTYKCFHCKTVNTINFNKACNKGMMNFIYQEIINKNMGIKESRNVYIT